MQQHRIQSYYPTISGMSAGSTAGSTAVSTFGSAACSSARSSMPSVPGAHSGTLAGTSKPRAAGRRSTSRGGEAMEEADVDIASTNPEQESEPEAADDGFICDDDEHHKTGTEQCAHDWSIDEAGSDAEYRDAIDAASRRKERKKRALEQHDGFSWLTPRNLEQASLRFRAEHGIVSDRLEDTLVAMHVAGWSLSMQLRDCIHTRFFAAQPGAGELTLPRGAWHRERPPRGHAGGDACGGLAPLDAAARRHSHEVL
jgi:hypothetical protein